jgi:hypothetical protein
MIGIKATHGCRNLLISGNMVTGADLWGILFNPGALSHYIESATGDQPARPANVDAGTIVANNIVSDYGYGNEYWNWGGASETAGGSFAIALFEGQLEENPPLRDILFTGNIVYDPDEMDSLWRGKRERETPVPFLGLRRALGGTGGDQGLPTRTSNLQGTSSILDSWGSRRLKSRNRVPYFPSR